MAGEVLWQEPLVWMAGDSYRDSSAALTGGALPLALFGENCVLRLAVMAALARAGMPWSLQYSGSSTTGLCHAVRCGLGLTALPRSLLAPGIAEISAVDGQMLPALPDVRLLAEHAPGAVTTAAQRFVLLMGAAMAVRRAN